MAADLRWYDQIVDRGWLPVLRPAAKDLLWGMARWTDRRPMRTRATPERLCDAVGIAPRTFRDAWAEVLGYRLVTVGQVDGRRYLYLTFPVPRVPVHAAKTRRYRGRISPPTRQNFATPPSRPAVLTGLPADNPQKTGQEKTKRKDRTSRSSWVVGVKVSGNGRLPHILTESDLLDLDPAVLMERPS